MSSAPLSAAPAVEAKRTWRAGALVYTPGSLAALFGWLLWGDFAFQLKERILVVAAPLMLRQFQASDFLVGLLVGSLPQALGMIITPIIGVKSDRHRSRWGRRIPFLVGPAPIASAALIGMAYTPELGAWLHALLLGADVLGVVACQLLAFAVCWTVFDLFTVFVNAIFESLINDVVPRTLIGKFFGLFRAVSLLAGIIFNFWIIGHVQEYFRIIFIALAVVYGGGLCLMCLYVKEGPLPPPDPEAQAKPGFLRSTKTYFKECFANPYYLWVFAAMTLGSLAGGPVNTFSIFYAQSLGMSMERYGKLLVVTFVVSFSLSFVLGWLADKFHPVRIGIATLVLYAGTMAWGAFFATSEAAFTVVFILHGVLMGSYLTGTASMRQRLFPAEKFAQFWSASNIVIGLGYVVVPPAVGLWLDATGNVYRYTFAGSAAIAVGGLVAYLVVFRRFMALGGPRAYVPPAI